MVPIFSGLTLLGHSYREDGNVDRVRLSLRDPPDV